jgi:hypothetical protein
MRVDRLIAASFTPAAAKAYRDFVPTEEQLDTVAEVGRDILNRLAPRAAACAPMSAVYAMRLQSIANIQCYVVAGSLRVGNTYVFGDGKPFDGRKVLSESNSSWDGHAWVVIGSHLADISLFRTVYAGKAHPLLTEHVRQEFGEGRGLMIVKQSNAPLSGLYYKPLYVPTEEQVAGLFRGARTLFG